MALYPQGFDPWGSPQYPLRRLQEEVNRAFSDMRLPQSPEFPPMNLWRGPNGIVTTVEVPGILLDDLEIIVHQNTLTIKGQRRKPAVESEAAYHRQERDYRPFTRTVSLPFNVDPDLVNARAQNGVLTIELPRPEADRPKRIQIKTA